MDAGWFLAVRYEETLEVLLGRLVGVKGNHMSKRPGIFTLGEYPCRSKVAVGETPPCQGVVNRTVHTGLPRPSRLLQERRCRSSWHSRTPPGCRPVCPLR